jgi:ATP-dependent RNA helicase DDX31/DBP7
LSSLRSYSAYSKEYKKIFHLKNIHLGHAAKSFGLREAPNAIAQNISHNRNSYNNDKETKGFNTIKKPFDQR